MRTILILAVVRCLLFGHNGTIIESRALTPYAYDDSTHTWKLKKQAVTWTQFSTEDCDLINPKIPKRVWKVAYCFRCKHLYLK